MEKIEKDIIKGRAVQDRLPAEEETTERSPLVRIVSGKQAVLFDLFHTLVSLQREPGSRNPELHEILGVSRQTFVDALRLTAHGRLIGVQTEAASIVSDIARATGQSVSDAAIKRTAERIVEVFSAALSGISDRVVSVLASLRHRGKRLGLVSNASAMEVVGWSRSPIAPLFDSVVFSCFCGSVKPEERIYRICTDELGVAPVECVFVGDGESNELEGAKNVGMMTVMTTQFIGGMEHGVFDERCRWADFIISQLDELVGPSNSRTPS
jgi:putative hydrolase of the HAD superfamily